MSSVNSLPYPLTTLHPISISTYGSIGISTYGKRHNNHHVKLYFPLTFIMSFNTKLYRYPTRPPQPAVHSPSSVAGYCGGWTSYCGGQVALLRRVEAQDCLRREAGVARVHDWPTPLWGVFHTLPFTDWPKSWLLIPSTLTGEEQRQLITAMRPPKAFKDTIACVS